MKDKLQARLKACLTHLFLSSVIIGLFLLVVYFIWYPAPYYTIHATFDVVKILLVVDVVLGPLLTLLLFDTGKSSRELTVDISLVVLVQVLALSWGMHVTYKMRPLVAAYYNGQFYTVTGQDMNEADREHAILPSIYDGPRLVYVEPIKDQQERLRNLTEVLNLNRKSQVFRPQYYADIADYYGQVVAGTRPGPVSGDAQMRSEVGQLLAEHGGTMDDYCYVPVLNADFVGTFVLDCKLPRIIGLINGRF